MQSLIENARRVFEIAESTLDGEPQDFALLLKPDGGLHFVMESTFSVEGAAQHAGAHCAFRVTRSEAGVRVEAQRYGFAETTRCVVEKRFAAAELLTDQPLYSISGPLLPAASQCEIAAAV